MAVVEPRPLDRRSVPEWIGATPDTPVPRTVKARVFERYDGHCYLSGAKIKVGDPWEVEHILAIALGGQNRESNLAPALVQPHKVKTAADRGRIAKADRVRSKHIGTWPKSKRPLKSRGFARSRPIPHDGDPT